MSLVPEQAAPAQQADLAGASLVAEGPVVETGAGAAPGPNPHRDSYGRILKSSSIIGGAQGINYLIGMVKTKVVALLLGPSGIGLVGLYVAATELVGAVSRLGINESGVREVAQASGSDDPKHLARTVRTLRRACWVTGTLGWMLTCVLAYPLSQWAFGSDERAWSIAVLGVTLLLSSVSGGQTALLQGTRRIGDLARLNVVSVLAGTLLASGLYAWLGQRGIVPVLILTAAVNAGFSWWFARRIQIARVELAWAESWKNAKNLVGLGAAFMWSGLVGAAVGLGIRSIIVRTFGTGGNGVYEAAWGMSGVFGGFIITAMGMDFYPRLTAMAHNPPEASRLVNEQTEIGVLLALPGLLATLAFAPWVMQIFYSSRFLLSAQLLPWFVLTVFIRMITFPMSYILLARGAGCRYASILTAFHVVHIACIAVMVPRLGLLAAAIINPVLSVFYLFGLRALAGPLVLFRWSSRALRLIGVSCVWILAAFVCAQLLVPGWREAVGALLTLSALVFSIRGFVSRLGGDHRIVQRLRGLPGGHVLCGV